MTEAVYPSEYKLNINEGSAHKTSRDMTKVDTNIKVIEGLIVPPNLILIEIRGRRSRDRMVLVPVQLVPITTKVVSSNPAHTTICDLRQVSGFFSGYSGFIHQ